MIFHSEPKDFRKNLEQVAFQMGLSWWETHHLVAASRVLASPSSARPGELDVEIIEETASKKIYVLDIADAERQFVISTKSRNGEQSTIVKPPGYALARLAEFIYSRRTYTQVFLPILSDLQLEYQEALAARRWQKARWVTMRGRWHFIAAALARIPASLTRLVASLWKLSGS